MNQKATQVPLFFSPDAARVLVLVALPEAGFHPLQPGLALLGCPGETLTGHPAGDDGEDVSRPVHYSQLLLDGVLGPHLDEGQGLRVCPRGTSGP